MVETSGACELGPSALSLAAWPCRYTNVRHSMGLWVLSMVSLQVKEILDLFPFYLKEWNLFPVPGFKSRIDTPKAVLSQP